MVSILRRPLSLVVVLTLLTLAIGAKLLIGGVAHAAATPKFIAPDLELTLLRCGLDADALAASGVSAGATTTVVSNVNTYLLANPNVFSTADSSYSSAKVASDALGRKVASGLCSDDDVTALAQATTDLETATSARAAAVSAAFDAGSANLSSPQKATLSTINTNRTWQMSTEYLTATLTQANWVKLRDALANKRISAKLGESQDPTSQAFIASVEEQGAVSSAKTALSNNKASCTGAWNAAIAN